MSLDFHILHAFASFRGQRDLGGGLERDSKEPLYLGLGKKGVDRSFWVGVCSRSLRLGNMMERNGQQPGIPSCADRFSE